MDYRHRVWSDEAGENIRRLVLPDQLSGRAIWICRSASGDKASGLGDPTYSDYEPCCIRFLFCISRCSLETTAPSPILSKFHLLSCRSQRFARFSYVTVPHNESVQQITPTDLSSFLYLASHLPRSFYPPFPIVLTMAYGTYPSPSDTGSPASSTSVSPASHHASLDPMPLLDEESSGFSSASGTPTRTTTGLPRSLNAGKGGCWSVSYPIRIFISNIDAQP